MGIVTDHLIQTVKRQVDDYGLVVWYDPDEHYTEVAHDLSIPETRVECYEGSFFALRHDIDELMNGSDAPRLVVYVPLDPNATHHALIEIEVAGVVMRPGQQPPARNTRLSIIARNALKPILGDETTAAIEKDIDAGKFSLADLDRLAEKGESFTTGIVSLVFGMDNPQDIALHFLNSERLDATLAKKDGIGQLAGMMSRHFDIDLYDIAALKPLRHSLARHALITDFMLSLRGELPPQLETVTLPASTPAREACTVLAQTWRKRSDFRESYVHWAQQIESELGLQSIPLTRGQIIGVETFLGTEKCLHHLVESAMLEESTAALVEVATARQSSFWSETIPEAQARWGLIAVAGQLLLEAERIEAEMEASPNADARAIFSAYAEFEDAPWCLFDTYHRHMERRYLNFDFATGEEDHELERLVNRARQRYSEVGSVLAERFLDQFQRARFHIEHVTRQREIFEKKVKPRLAEGKTAYIWVDALRFEMARELVQILRDEFVVELEPTIGTAPTITEIGMAALLPNAHETSTQIVAVGESRLALQIGDIIIKDRQDRIRYLSSNAGTKVLDIRLDELLPKPNRKTEKAIRDAELILITSQEIDLLGESGNPFLARQMMDSVLLQLQRAIRALFHLGVKSIVVAADHGYIFGEGLSVDMKIDAPGGDTADLHRRVWLGHGGAASPAYLRANLSDFSIGGDLEIAAPWNFSCFKVAGGGTTYFHGGLSPQELIVPVVTMTSIAGEKPTVSGNIIWVLVPGSQKIGRFLSVKIEGTSEGLFVPTPPKVRVEVFANEKVISAPVSASYGYEEGTGNVQLKAKEDNPRAFEPNTVALVISEEGASEKSASIRLLDATTGVELKRSDKMEIAIFM